MEDVLDCMLSLIVVIAIAYSRKDYYLILSYLRVSLLNTDFSTYVSITSNAGESLARGKKYKNI